MSTHVTCTACDSRVKIGAHQLGNRIKCPQCGEAFLAEAAEEHVTAIQAETRVKVPGRSAEARAGETDDDDDVDERRERVKKKKKKGKKKKAGEPSFLLSLVTTTSGQWWLFGGGAIAVTMVLLLAGAIFAGEDGTRRGVAIYLFIMQPISAVIFFVAMYLSSIWFGAIEIGELHIAFVKAFFLVLVVNIVGLLPFGGMITLVVWFVGLITVFQLDVWEARVLIFLNWSLNFGLKLLLFMALMSGMNQGGDRNFDPNLDRGRPGAIKIDDDD